MCSPLLKQTPCHAGKESHNLYTGKDLGEFEVCSDRTCAVDRLQADSSPMTAFRILGWCLWRGCWLDAAAAFAAQLFSRGQRRQHLAAGVSPQNQYATKQGSREAAAAMLRDDRRLLFRFTQLLKHSRVDVIVDESNGSIPHQHVGAREMGTSITNLASF